MVLDLIIVSQISFATSYPKDSEKIMLARQTGLTKNQVQ